MNFRKLGAVAAATLTFGAGGTVVADRQINPYDDKGAHYELSLKSDIPQGEHVEIAKDRAAMTLKGWNDEYAITIEPQIPTLAFGAAKKIGRPFTVKADRPLLSKKMEYRSGDVTAFVEPKKDTENEFDIDFTLHSKPDTNVFEYKIAGAEDFDFFYQPELTPEDIAEGASRPDNVVGSYAVYHKTKANHRIGSTNYATGKAFHIYRPKAIDANGAWVWAQLSYGNGLLTVTVPQKFLDDALYPVMVDPTFGKTSIGATSVSWPNANKSTSQFNLPDSSVSISKLTTYYSSGGTCNIYGIIYNDNGSNAPNALKGTTDILVTVSAGWNDLTFASPLSLTSSGNYWLGVISSTVCANGRGDSAGNNAFNSDSPPPDNPFGTPSSSSFQKSVYATYTASGGGSGSSSTPQVIIFE